MTTALRAEAVFGAQGLDRQRYGPMRALRESQAAKPCCGRLTRGAVGCIVNLVPESKMEIPANLVQEKPQCEYTFAYSLHAPQL